MSDTVPPNFTTPDVIKRHPTNPILSAKDVIGYPATLIFNAGVVKYQGQYVMVFRNDYGRWGDPKFDGTNLGLATSDNGIDWTVADQPCIDLAKARELIAPFYPDVDPAQELHRFYDPRLTVIEGKVAMTFAVDTKHGLRGGIALTEDFEQWDIVHLTVPDNRNMVLFPEKVDGQYVRLERPFNSYGSQGHMSAGLFSAWLNTSPDLKHWGSGHLLLRSRDLAFANDKIGPAAPPIKTEKGWLTTFHTTWVDDARGKHGWEPKWPKIYYAGLMLLDLHDPRKIIGLYNQPLIAPEVDYETGHNANPEDPTDPNNGFRNHVIFPGGMILEDDGEVKIYYGAADTVECVATASVDELVELCM